MRTLWIIAGMRRSGIHPIVNWIKAAIDTTSEPHVLLNNVHLPILNSKESNAIFSKSFASSDSANEHVLVVFEDKRLRRIIGSPLLQRIGGDRRKHIVVLRLGFFHGTEVADWGRARRMSPRPTIIHFGGRRWRRLWNQGRILGLIR